MILQGSKTRWPVSEKFFPKNACGLLLRKTSFIVFLRVSISGFSNQSQTGFLGECHCESSRKIVHARISFRELVFATDLHKETSDVILGCFGRKIFATSCLENQLWTVPNVG